MIAYHLFTVVIAALHTAAFAACCTLFYYGWVMTP
jgi:hypothetical protein